MIRKWIMALLALALAVLLTACRGGGLVFKGFHGDQDKALLERLEEEYPEMEFQCTGQAEGSRHAPLLYFNGSFTVEGEEHFRMFYLSMRQGDIWNFDYAYDDYESVLRDAIEQSKKKQDVPNIE